MSIEAVPDYRTSRCSDWRVCHGKRHDIGPRSGSLLAANAEYDRAIIAGDAAVLDQIYVPDFSFVGDKAELRNKDRRSSTPVINGDFPVEGRRSYEHNDPLI